MVTYEHQCESCQHEWEEEYSIKANPPTQCPKCQIEGQVKRLISGGSGRGIVELTGHELTDKLKTEAGEIKKAMYTSEKVYANLLGEDKYQGIQRQIDRRNQDRPRIKGRRRA